MKTSNIVDFASRDGISDGLTDLLRAGAQQLIVAGVAAELESFLAQYDGRAQRQATPQLCATGIIQPAVCRPAV